MEQGGAGHSYRGGGSRGKAMELAKSGGETSTRLLPWLEKASDERRKKTVRLGLMRFLKWPSDLPK